MGKTPKHKGFWLKSRHPLDQTDVLKLKALITKKVTSKVVSFAKVCANTGRDGTKNLEGFLYASESHKPSNFKKRFPDVDIGTALVGNGPQYWEGFPCTEVVLTVGTPPTQNEHRDQAPVGKGKHTVRLALAAAAADPFVPAPDLAIADPFVPAPDLSIADPFVPAPDLSIADPFVPAPDLSIADPFVPAPDLAIADPFVPAPDLAIADPVAGYDSEKSEDDADEHGCNDSDYDSDGKHIVPDSDDDEDGSEEEDSDDDGLVGEVQPDHFSDVATGRDIVRFFFIPRDDEDPNWVKPYEDGDSVTGEY
jgi:hypothetical protein